MSDLSIAVCPYVLMSATISGFARAGIDVCILLKEIPVFHSAGQGSFFCGHVFHGYGQEDDR